MKKPNLVLLGVASIAVAIGAANISHGNAKSTGYPVRVSPVDPTGGRRIHQGCSGLTMIRFCIEAPRRKAIEALRHRLSKRLEHSRKHRKANR